MSLRPLRNLASSLFGLALVIAISLGIVWPIWYAATSWTKGYTAVAILAIVLAAGYGVVVRVRRHIRRDSRNPPRGTSKDLSGFATVETSGEP
jgi:uncharacterized membrane protein YcjF (UPF0283 family)